MEGTAVNSTGPPSAGVERMPTTHHTRRQGVSSLTLYDPKTVAVADAGRHKVQIFRRDDERGWSYRTLGVWSGPRGHCSP